MTLIQLIDLFCRREGVAPPEPQALREGEDRAGRVHLHHQQERRGAAEGGLQVRHLPRHRGHQGHAQEAHAAHPVT